MSMKWIAGSLIALTAATSFGCAGATSPSQTATTPMAATAQADRHVQAVGNTMTFNQVVDQLPKRISEADASRLLTTIDPSKVSTDENAATVQQGFRFRGGLGGRGLGIYGHRGFYGGFGHRFNRFRYFGYGGRYFPYYLNRGFYYPYTYGSVYPYFYNYANTYYPYSCGYGGYNWGY